MIDEIKKQILDSGKLTEAKLNEKVSEKMQALSGLISEEGALHIIANELNINSIKTNENTPPKIKDVVGGMRNLVVLGKVVRKYDLRTFGEDSSGKVGSLLLGDETGLSRLTFWNDKCEFFEQIKEGDILEVQNAYSKENNGRVELHMGNGSNCILNPDGVIIEVKEKQEFSENLKKISEINENDTYVDLMATIVQVYDPRFFEVCPECNKRMQILDEGKFKCAEHGVKIPAFNYVVNLFLDDGSGSLRATLWKEQIQELFSMKDEEVVKLRENTADLEKIKNDLLGRIIKARAKVKKNEAFNQIELVLYNLNLNPEPIVEKTIKEESSKKDSIEKPKAEDSKVQEEDVSISEEMINDDEEIYDLDDLDDNLD